ncbi:hypothetical protein DND132_0279 [Pseudodesulfovibrio mercurii]|uniref:Uncharacterized protein n=1 Tax=Pseudodesulfovibrio mercurii TaxID=641491 RepID=F0JED3_9BACT|nr:hypothetical protein [Pseudodesulfovibrio mercurii]EGB13496.1 hypothetical protein DND132_0279 [Pseudodesulfovibrio mercurii]
MDITITTPASPLPCERAYSLSMVIRSFKGRRDVEVHLFRARWGAGEESDPGLGDLMEHDAAPGNGSPESRKVVLESFTADERDLIVNYLKQQYSTRLTAIRSNPLTFPVPTGLAGFTEIQPGKDAGFIEFEKIPSYSLDFPLKGYFDLSRHLPLADED